ncbi:MAG TPA: ABC transporter permease subunit [Allosphingosinicella sp.]|jgi:sodium transport system permease protein
MIGFSGFGTIFSTTLVDQSRDRRSMGAALIYALLGPVVMLLAFTALANTRESSETLTVAVHGAEHAPGLLAHLEGQGARIERRSGGPGRDFGGADAVLVIPQGFEASLAQGRAARVALLRDDRRQKSTIGAGGLERQIEDYGRAVAARSLAARGLPETLAAPVSVEARNVAPVSGRALMIVNMMLYFFILAPFFTSMTAAIDATAGERERQSLKPLLAQPIDPAGLIGGKWAVAALFGAFGTALTVFFGIFLIGFAPLEKLGFDLPLTLLHQAGLALLLAPLAFAVAAIQVLVAMLAKSFKEAQTYIQLLSLAPVALLFNSTFSGGETGSVGKIMPVTGHSDLLRRLLTEGTLDIRQAALVTATSLLFALLCLWMSQRQVGDEKLMGKL